jgi:D-alanyl-D-alanine carboxypeptidase
MIVQTTTPGRRRILVAVVALALLGAACRGLGSGVPDLPGEPVPPAAGETETADTTADPAPSFHGLISTIGPRTRMRMSLSWRPGCPVSLDDLRLLTLDHWGFDGRVHVGEIVVHENAAEDVLGVFRAIFRAHFPIERMELVDAYGAGDDMVMAANDTSGFNCRFATGQPGVWSEHSYGRAIDVNPLQNPYVDGDVVLPEAGRDFLDRSRRAKGVITPHGPVVRAFASIGWTWGGEYRSVKDYQHFSLTGR